MSYSVTFWGTRGSIPTPGPGTARYGGNTPCVSVEAGPDQLVILDAGSGIRPLGNVLARQPGTIRADVLLSHTHWDHIQGLPFFRPLYESGNTVRIFGARQGEVALEDILDRQMEPVVFPVPLRALAAELTVQEVTEGRFEIDGFVVDAFRLRHPGTTLGYKLVPQSGGRSIAYLTDNELGPAGQYPVADDWRTQLQVSLAGVDTLIHDAMYSDALLAQRAGWGHSSAGEAVDLAVACGVTRLVLFHHEPEHDDDALDALLADAGARARANGARLTVEAAREGMTLTL